MNVLVLLGGTSDEREVSLRSGNAVIEALKNNGHNVKQYDPADGYGGLTKFIGKVDVVMPILHGKGGEDGTIQAELEKLGFKYLGADSKSSELCFNKVRLKKMLNQSSILTPNSETVGIDEFHVSSIKKTGKYVLKPIGGGSTIDAYIVNEHTDLVDVSVFEKYPEMLLEELIEGTEITIPVLDDIALPVIEIIPPAGEDFDYENKYNGETQELCPPRNVSMNIQTQARAIAERIHTMAGVRHLSRTDIIIDKQNKLWVLEINTIPGLTDQSLFPKSAAQAGISFNQLVDKFVRMASRSII